MPKNIVDKSGNFEDAVNREEIHAILNRISQQVKRLSGKDLELLKNYLKKITEY